MRGSKLLQGQVGPSPDYSDDYEVEYADVVGIRVQSGADGEVQTGSDHFVSASATFLDTHIGQFIITSGSGFPPNNVAVVIASVVSPTEVVVELPGGGAPSYITETGLAWAHHELPSLGADLAFVRTMLALTRHPTRAWNNTRPRKGILHVAAPIPADTNITLPNSLDYAIDASANGLYLDVFVNGELWTPDEAGTPHDYAEFSSTKITTHHDLLIGDVLTFIVHGA